MPAAPSVPWPAPRLIEELARGGPSVVALSGGVDSAVVAALAHRALGSGAFAVTMTGPAVSRAEVDRARSVATSLGIQHELLPVDQLTSAEYRANPSSRCYYCRQTEMVGLRRWADERSIRRILDGIHLDDLGDERPGLRALEEADVVHPLLTGGWRKADVRAFARSISLPNWDAPSEACLASRIAHGRPISAELLVRVEHAEAELHRRGFRRVRVRTDGLDARVVVDPDEVERLLREPMASEVRGTLAHAGFRTVTLDPIGYPARPGA